MVPAVIDVQRVRGDVLALLLRSTAADAPELVDAVLGRIGPMVGARRIEVARWTDQVMGAAPTWRWRDPRAGTAAPGRASTVDVALDDRRSHVKVVIEGQPVAAWPTGAEAVVREAVELMLCKLDRLAVERVASRAEALLRRGLDDLDQIVYVYDPGSVHGSYVNRAYETVYGLARSTWFEDPLVFLHRVHPDDREAVVDVIAMAQAAIRRGDVTSLAGRVQAEFRVVGPDGTVRWLTTRAFPIADDTDAPPLLVGVTEDVTAERELERALTQARVRAEAANRAKNRFLSRMSHELRTPLHAILGYAQLLELGTDDPRRLEQLARIRRAGEHVVGLVDDVLDIARIEEGRLSFDPRPVVAGDAVREAVDLVGNLASERGAEVTVVIDPSAVAHADRRRLVEVLVNLLSNAVTHGPAGARVVVRARHSPEGVVFDVADEGPGLTPDELQRAFEPFERLDCSAEVPGTGLGLTLVKALVEGMGGAIEVTSERGRGSTFSVTVPPSASVMTGAAPSAPPPTAAPAADRLVLCIEDDPDSARVLVEAVSRLEGARAFAAGRADVGLALARTHRPDVVLLDRHLPDRAGEDVVAALRADPSTAACRIVVVSADATRVARQRLLEAGADAYLTKPLDLVRLYAVLAEAATDERAER